MMMSRRRVFVSVVAALWSLTGHAQVAADSLGIYAVSGDGTTVKMEVNAYDDLATGNALASALTVGLVPMKGDYVFNGATSSHHFRRRAHLRMYFKPAVNPTRAEQIIFDTCYAVTDFRVARMKVKDDRRLLEAISVNIVKAREGVVYDHDTHVSYRQLRPGVFDVYIDAKPGEYCLVFSGIKGNWGGYVYDFTIEAHPQPLPKGGE